MELCVKVVASSSRPKEKNTFKKNTKKAISITAAATHYSVHNAFKN
jgi:hypothetical protein